MSRAVVRRSGAPAAGQVPYPTRADAPCSPAARVGAYALVLWLTALLALWGSFLVPFRVGGTLVPVCWVVAVAGNVALGRAAAGLVGAAGAGGTGLLWVGTTIVLASRREEGDVVVPGTYVGLGFLLLGAVASAVTYGLAVRRARA